MNFKNIFVAFCFYLVLSAVLPAGEPGELERLHSAYLPKREVGQPEFLKAHPEWDGRGVVIAVFDTGVDPSAAGLAVTTTGERKVLNIFDASGSGDVDTSTVVKPTEEGTVSGLSGRTLTLPAGMVNPDGDVRLGLKGASEIFPAHALKRLKAHETRIWEGELSEIRARRALQQRGTDRSFADKALEDQTLAEQDQAAQEAALESLEESYAGSQTEIHFDCVVWNDGEFWRVLVDTDRDGDLSDETLLRPYGIAGEYGIFGPVSNLTYGVQVYEGGDLLSIVTVNGTHGTHVASIAAAHDPDNPERNGIAPGAQIISIRIGDHRSGGSYGDSERRAVALAAQSGVDIVNASWGGLSVYQDGLDANSQTYDMLVEQYGIFTVVSAGNNGPALSTLGTAGGEARRVLGVGAYVSPEMGEVLYNTLQQTDEASLQFSSRGPSKDGDWGVDVTAPGAALASYSGESLTGFRMANGTSMSSPCAAGVAALLMSGGKQEGLAMDPARLRAAMMLGARWIESEAVYTQGRGLLNVSHAWDKLREIQEEQAFGAFYDLEVSKGSFNPKGRGLYLREPEPEERLRVSISVSPEWIEAVSAKKQVLFDSRFSLRSTVDWIEVPEFFHLANADSYFVALVTVPEMVDSLGSLYTAEIQAVLTGKEKLGPVFTVPVTIVRGKSLPDDSDKPFKTTLSMEPARTERLFFNVPEGADWLKVKVRHLAEDPIARLYILHGVTLSAETPMFDSGEPNYMRLEEGEERILNLPTFGDEVMELTVYQYWSSVGSSKLEMELEWGGLGLEQSPVAFTENQGWAQVPLKSLRDQKVKAEAKLDQAVHVFMPVMTKRLPFDERGALPPSPETPTVVRQEMERQVFEVNFEEPFKGTLIYPQNYDISDFYGGGLTEIFHESGEQLFSGLTLPEKSIEFPKGKSFVIRHYNQVKGQKLEQAKHFPLLLQQTLEQAPKIPVYKNLRARFTGKAVEELDLKGGHPEVLFLQDSALPKLYEMKPKADFYAGKLAFKAQDGAELGEKDILYYMGTPLEKALAEDPKAKEAADERSASEKLGEALYDQRLAFVREERGTEDETIQRQRRELLDTLIEEQPDDPEPVFEKALLLAIDAGLAGKWWKGREVEAVDKAASGGILDLLEKARQLADPDSVAAFIGAPPQAAPGDMEGRHALERRKKKVDEARALLTSIAHLKADVYRVTEQIDLAWTALLEASRWESEPGETTRAIKVALYEAEGFYGLALKIINERLKENPFDRELLDQRIATYHKLGWERFANSEKRKLAVRKTNQTRVEKLRK